jgi:small subunit ribosomal protein S4
MGDPRKHRRKYSKPSHPWQKERIGEEKDIMKEYGLKNKKELWKMESKLKKLSQQAKKLIAEKGEQAEKEKAQLLSKLTTHGLLPGEADLTAVLGITLKDVLNRRLQTIIYKKNLAKSMKQARQFITHRHITVKGRKVTNPSYLVTQAEEETIIFSPFSKLSSSEHPEKVVNKKK